MEALRPVRLEDVAGQRSVVVRLKSLATGARDRRAITPNLLMYGPPGVGKTTAARAFGRAALGDDWENGFHELRACDDRSAEQLRLRIVPLSRVPPSRGAGCRIIFLDDVDTFGPESFAVLRPALEGEGGSTVFLLACNELDRVPLAVQSRCILLRFSLLGEKELAKVVLGAMARLPESLEPRTVKSVVRRAGGVPREAVKILLEEFLANGRSRVAQTVQSPVKRLARE